MKTKLYILFILFLLPILFSHAQVGIGTSDPNTASMLDIQSNSKGLLIPRLTVTERDNIVTPVEGLQIYNTTNNTLDVFSNSAWKSFAYSKNSNLVYVYSLDDLPTPTGSEITLDGTKMYVFSGAVDISPNYILMNGAGLRGTDPQKDMIISNVGGAVLRSVDTGVFIQDLAVAPNSSTTKAYDFSDTTGTNFCNIFSGSSVVELVPSLGVGQISGFNAVTFAKNYWKVTDGLKVTGDMGKFASNLNFITGITSGSGIEFLSGLIIDDIDLSNNYFIYTGQTGIKVNTGATIDRGRLSINMFRGVGTPLDGITSFDLGWNMAENTDISDTKAIGFVYFNTTNTTTFTNSTDFVKVAGTTTAAFEQKFTAGNNILTYDGRRPIVADISASINAESPGNGSGYTIAISKNGQAIGANAPVNTISELGNNNKFQLSLNTNIDLVTGDTLEVFIRSNVGTSALVVDGLQFNVNN